MTSAHGVGGRQDLPIPFGYAVTGAALAVLVSFVALGLLWRRARLHGETAGVPLPAGLARLLDARGTRLALRVAGVLLTGYALGLGLVLGRNDNLNPTPGVVYVLFWVGLVPASLLLGPVWRLLNPLRAVHAAIARVSGSRPEAGLVRLPEGLGWWPAAAGLLGFAWLELVQPTRTDLGTLRLAVAFYVGGQLLAAAVFGSRWFDRGDPFEAWSTLVGRLAVVGRRPSDGRLVLRNPLAGLDALRPEPGLTALVGVMLGSTAFDGLSRSTWWLRLTIDHDEVTAATVALLLSVLLVTVALYAASTLALLGVVPWRQAAGRFAHSVVPIAVGYLVAHYYSLLVLVGQQTLIRLSDPLGTGADWLGTRDRGVDGRLADPNLVSTLQVVAVVVGHVLGVVLAHDRAVAVLPPRRAVVGQLPLMVLMVGYTVLGLLLLFAR